MADRKKRLAKLRDDFETELKRYDLEEAPVLRPVLTYLEKPTRRRMKKKWGKGRK